MRRLMIAALAVAALTSFAEYKPEAWNLEARQKFAEQRFGIFIHWGLYANFAQGEWYLQQGKLDREAYERTMHAFMPSKYDAGEWAKAFKASGAKYVTITSRHHDGFSLWPTKVDDGYNVANTPFKRDILGELAKACKAEGLQLNFYYSLMDWHRKDYPPGGCAKPVLGDQKGDYKSYKKFMMDQIAELIDSYHPGNIWFDGEWEQYDKTVGGTFDWEFDDIFDLIHSKKTLVANNNHKPIRAKEDLQLFERDLPGENGTGFSAGQTVTRDRPLEQCDVIQDNVWGYKIGEKKFRTPENVVEMVARAAAHDSNLLMNIGPDASGQLPRRAKEVLYATGKWFEKNGESIYGTTAGGLAIGKDVVSTRKGDYLYLHILNKDLQRFCFALDGDIVEAKYLDYDRVPFYQRTGIGDVVINVERPKDYAFDLVLRLKVTGGRAARLEWAKTQTEAKTFTDSTGNAFNYRWHEPKDLKANEKAPLVVFLHGAGERGSNNFAQMVHGVPQILKYAERKGQKIFLLAGQVPAGACEGDPQGNKWVQVPWDAADTIPPMPAKPSKSMNALIELLAQVRRDPRIDTFRIYATGVSMGGYGTWDLVMRKPEWFAAAMPCCAGADNARVYLAKEVPLWIFHGGSDGVVPTVRGRLAYKAFCEAGGKARYTEYPGVGHNSWEPMYNDDSVLDWLFSNVRK